MNKAYRFRLYPTKEQAQFFDITFGCARFIYNKMLADKIAYYKETGKTLYKTPAKYKIEFPWLREADSHALNNSQMNLQAAYNNFFKTPSIVFPKFKSKKYDKACYTTNNTNNFTTIKLLDNKIKLPKAGPVKCKVHRSIPENWLIKSATITKTPAGKYFVSVLFYYEKISTQKALSTNKAIGIDYLSNGFGITSDGEVLSSHRYFRENQAKLAKEQRKLSRKKRYSKNYEKQRKKVALVYEHIANCRKEQAHQLSSRLSKRYDIICLEDINLRSLAQTLKLGKSTNDNGFGMFRNFLQYKMHDLGKLVIYTNKWQPTSTVCSCCGAYHKDIVNSLAVRTWTCPDCGVYHDRDINAAKNILAVGLTAV